jgi:hypothetical protein
MLKLASSTAVAALLFAAPAFAQTAPAPANNAAAPAAQTSSAKIDYVQMQSEGQWLASNVMGEAVRGPNNENIGEINNLLVDKDGRVTAAVIGVGGFLGIGEKDVAVPFNSLQLSNEADGTITLAATEEDLRNAPEFKDLDDQNSEKNQSAAQTGMPATTNNAGGAATSPAAPATPAAPAQ